SAPHPALTVFDAPDSTNTCTRRNRSNTPLQALTLLNDQAFSEFAQALAVRVFREVQTNDTDRLRHAFRLCLARPPSAREEKILQNLLARQAAGFAADPEGAKRVAPVAEFARIQPGGAEFLRIQLQGAKVDEKQMATWTMVARALLNLDEFI